MWAPRRVYFAEAPSRQACARTLCVRASDTGQAIRRQVHTRAACTGLHLQHAGLAHQRRSDARGWPVVRPQHLRQQHVALVQHLRPQADRPGDRWVGEGRAAASNTSAVQAQFQHWGGGKPAPLRGSAHCAMQLLRFWIAGLRACCEALGSWHAWLALVNLMASLYNIRLP